MPEYQRIAGHGVGHLLHGHWAERATGLGWDAAGLFDCHPVRLDHLQGARLLWRIGGATVIEINGKRQVVHRRPTPANFVLPWTLPYERPVARMSALDRMGPLTVADAVEDYLRAYGRSVRDIFMHACGIGHSQCSTG